MLRNLDGCKTINAKSCKEAAMTACWRAQSGHLTCNWSQAAERVQDRPSWMQESSDVRSPYLPPIPDFASHSPFGGAFWFEPITTRGASE